MYGKLFTLAMILLLAGVFIFSYPRAVSEPAARPDDPDKEDLSRIEYPSTLPIKWKAYFIRPQDSMERLFGKNWIYVARFNRIDRRHVYPGMTIKIPGNMEEIKNYTPMPPCYALAQNNATYILVDITEQWLGAYEYGKLSFSFPAATGIEEHLTPTGIFRIDAHHLRHKSSLYKTPKGEMPYPMDYAIRFYVGYDDVAFWIHARDLPGRPASHGCIGVYDETMQNRVYGTPADPVLNDAQRLYEWVVGKEDLQYDYGELEYMEDGPVVEIKGNLPRYLDKPSQR
jgi:hypothetical protein